MQTANSVQRVFLPFSLSLSPSHTHFYFFFAFSREKKHELHRRIGTQMRKYPSARCFNAKLQFKLWTITSNRLVEMKDSFFLFFNGHTHTHSSSGEQLGPPWPTTIRLISIMARTSRSSIRYTEREPTRLDGGHCHLKPFSDKTRLARSPSRGDYYAIRVRNCVFNNKNYLIKLASLLVPPERESFSVSKRERSRNACVKTIILVNPLPDGFSFQF